jgi:hypothetical protein
MSTITVEPCFLCQSPARCQETDHGTRRHYHCSSASCGEFEVSVAAMEQLEGNSAFKRTASKIAAGVVDPGKILEIRMSDGPDTDLQVEVVGRRS